MPTIMADHDIEGQFKELLRILLSPEWSNWWTDLGCKTETFASLGLSERSPDVMVWEACQAHQVVLVTGNRNDDGPDSLEATIRRLNQADSLPVITISKPQEVAHRSYAERAAVRLLEYLSELDKFRGTGRLYIP
jgi:hypothetical protein